MGITCQLHTAFRLYVFYSLTLKALLQAYIHWPVTKVVLVFTIVPALAYVLFVRRSCRHAARSRSEPTAMRSQECVKAN